MDRRDGQEMAARIATARVARRLTQDELAAAAAVSVSLVRKIERSARPVTPRVLRALADALDLDPGQLAGTTRVTDSRVHAAIPAIRRALDAYDLPDGGPVRSLPQLQRAVAEAQQWRLSSQYARLSEQLPALLFELCQVRRAVVSDRAEVAGLLTSALRSADGVAYKFGYHDLSARLVDLMQRTALEAGDELLSAAVAYVRTETYFATGNLTAALRALVTAAAQVTPDTRTAAAAYGALHMRAAVVAGRLGQADTARAHLNEAHDTASRVREGVYHGDGLRAGVCAGA